MYKKLFAFFLALMMIICILPFHHVLAEGETNDVDLTACIGLSQGGTYSVSTTLDPYPEDMSTPMNMTIRNSEEITITATPNDGYQFKGFYLGIIQEMHDPYQPGDGFVQDYDSNTLISSVNPYTFTVSGNVEIYALFEKKLPTLTLHFSSLDGDDLVDPIVIEDIAPGTTLESAIQEGIGKYIWDELFTKEGYRDSKDRTLEPLNNYANRDEYDAADLSKNTVINKDMDVYVGMFKEIDEVEITITAPICGVETDTPYDDYLDYWKWSEQTNKPEFSTPSGKNYHVDPQDMYASNWLDMEDDLKPFIGTFEGEKTYKGEYWLEADLGYTFVSNDDFDEYTGTATVNGGTFVETWFDWEYLGIIATITADHDWDEGEVKIPPTIDTKGEMEYKCKHYDTCGGTKIEPIPQLEPVTLTLHFSCVDGDDLMEPIVIEGIEPGTSILDAVKDKLDKDFDLRLFVKEGYDDSLYRTPKPIINYTNWDELNDADIDVNTQINTDMDVYVCMFKAIDAVEITAIPPICGVETTTAGDSFYWDFSTQTNRPVFTTPSDVNYKKDSSDGPSYWTEMESDFIPFIGTFEGGETYRAIYWLEANFGYYFAGSFDDWDYTGTAMVNDGTFVDTWWDWDFLGIVATVKAEHDWNDWVVTLEPTAEKEGLERRTCKNCDETQERPIAKITYNNIKGDDQVWYKGSGQDASFTFKRSFNDNETYNRFLGIQIDDKDVDKTNYIYEEGSVIVDLKASYMETLSIGKHTIKAIFNDGQAKANFEIRTTKPNPIPYEIPKTGVE